MAPVVWACGHNNENSSTEPLYNTILYLILTRDQHIIVVYMVILSYKETICHFIVVREMLLQLKKCKMYIKKLG